MSENAARAGWADVAKGACIVLVVLWHVVEKHYLRIDWRTPVSLPGFWGHLGEQLLPIRMPLFFTISGLLAARAIARPWPVLLRTRVARFGYLYAVWLVIHTVLLAGVDDFPTAHARSLPELITQLTVTPSNLWYLYALAGYFAVAKACARLPAPVVLTAALMLAVASASGLLATPGNRFGVYENLVFFLAGRYLGPQLTDWVATASRRRLAATAAAYAAALVTMATLNAHRWPGVWFAVSVCGVLFATTAAVVAAPLAPTRALAALGRRTLPVYVIHMPVLVLLDLITRGPLSRLGSAGQLVAAAAYPVAATALVIGVCLAVQRMLPRRWLFDLPIRAPRRQADHEVQISTKV